MACLVNEGRGGEEGERGEGEEDRERGGREGEGKEGRVRDPLQTHYCIVFQTQHAFRRQEVENELQLCSPVPQPGTHRSMKL